jgi:hypothetical protein
MKLRLLKIFALIGVVLFVAALWPVFTQAETSLAAGFVIVSAAGIGIAALALFSNKRWLLWAALGVWPGALTGGLLFAVIAWLTIMDDTTGWAVVIVILGVFIGGIAGAITGGVLGSRKTRRVNSTG